MTGGAPQLLGDHHSSQQRAVCGRGLEASLPKSYRDFQYLLVDDASTDSTPEIMSQYAAQDDRIVPISISGMSTTARPSTPPLTPLPQRVVAILGADDIAYPAVWKNRFVFWTHIQIIADRRAS
ncbi:MAG: glycosyltransferase family A protein [Caldilineaceae bacterium]